MISSTYEEIVEQSIVDHLRESMSYHVANDRRENSSANALNGHGSGEQKKIKNYCDTESSHGSSCTSKESKNEGHVLVLYTGGTIGMVRNEKGALIPKTNAFVENLRKYPQMHDCEYATEKYGTTTKHLILPTNSPEQRRIVYDVVEYSPLCDSSDMTMDDWIRIANDIDKSYEEYDGFVVLHGTDTLSYTASALSFMLECLDKIVVLTGSQVPIFDMRSDGLDNFLTSLMIAANYRIPEVCVFFGTNLMRGNRTSKVSTSSFDAFHSPNFPPLATAGIKIEVNHPLVSRPCNTAKFHVHSTLNRNVGLLRMFPGITFDLVKAFLQPPTVGVVLQTYGAGNMPTNRRDIFMELRAAAQRGIIIVNITQCTTGCVSDTYEAGRMLKESGVMSGFDMTPEAALTKLAYVLSKREWDTETKRQMMQSNLRGELTHSRKCEKVEEWDIVEAVARSLKLSTSELHGLGTVLIPAMLNAAALESDVQKLQLLKEYGADISQGNADGRTALHTACRVGNLDVVRHLLRMGANVNSEDRFQRTPLVDAVECDNHEIIEVLLKSGAKLEGDLISLTDRICNVAATGNEKRLQSFLKAGANLSGTNASGRSALHLAALHKRTAIVKLLLNQGANVHCVDVIGHTPCDLARLVGATEIVKLLTLSPKCCNGLDHSLGDTSR